MVPDLPNECPDCGMTPAACPFCGQPAKVYGTNSVGCIDTVGCGGEMNFGHWCGQPENGVYPVHYVIEQWNKRVTVGKTASPDEKR